jgi:hypothetical protein
MMHALEMGESEIIQHFKINQHLTLWHKNQMPSVMCSRPELKWGQHNKGHDTPSAICIICHFKHNCTIGIPGVRYQTVS